MLIQMEEVEIKARVKTEDGFISGPFIREYFHVRMTFCFLTCPQKLQGLIQKNLNNEDPIMHGFATKDALAEKVRKHST